jgi:periplasmic copper chaperone A
MKKMIGIITSVALLAGVAACSSDDAATPTTPEITVSGQWARQSPMATDMGAAYMTIEASAFDELIGASVDMSVAMMTEVHETVMVDGGMKMQEVSRIDVAPDNPIVMEPGGYHVMLMGLVQPLEVGQTISVTLKFSKSGDKVIDVPVLEDAP